MKIIQLNNLNTTVTIPNDATDVHIGIEHFHSHPLNDGLIRNINMEFEDMYLININNEPYYINECDILEFNKLQGSVTVSPSDLDSNTFVTIGYNVTSSEN